MSEGRLSIANEKKRLPQGKKKSPKVSNRETGLVSSLWQGVVEQGAVRTTSLFIHMGPRQERIKTQSENLRVTLGLCGLGTVGSS